MHDNTPIQRQWLLLKSLSARRHGRTLREMAADAGVGPKTIRRDLDLFRALGFPLEEMTGESGRKAWVLKSPCHQPPPDPASSGAEADGAKEKDGHRSTKNKI